jgi:hypothetical protein
MIIILSLGVALLSFSFYHAVMSFAFDNFGKATTLFVLCYWILGCIIPFGIALYALRCRHRTIYGIFEVAASIVLMLVAVNSYVRAFGQELSWLLAGAAGFWPVDVKPPEADWLQWAPTSFATIQIVLAIYVFVRGMDNIGEGLPDLGLANWERRWRRIFPRRTELGLTWWQWFVQTSKHLPADPPNNRRDQ